MKTDLYAIYARVSTEGQTHDSQLEELRAYCQRRGWKEVVEITDTASGGAWSRTGLDRLMNMVRRGQLDGVVVFRLDRLARSLAHLAQMLGELQANRTALICPGQGIDTSNSNPASQLQINILAAVAEFEKGIIVERVNAGLRAAKARGVRLGRPSTLETHVPAVRELVKKGLGPCAISRALGLPLSSAGRLVKRARKDQ